MKKGLICLSIEAILTLCVLNVAVATTSKYSTDVHSGRVPDVWGNRETYLYARFVDPDSNTSGENCTVAVNKPVVITGRLIAEGYGDNPFPVPV